MNLFHLHRWSNPRRGWGCYQKREKSKHDKDFHVRGTAYSCECGKSLFYPDNKKFSVVECEPGEVQLEEEGRNVTH